LPKLIRMTRYIGLLLLAVGFIVQAKAQKEIKGDKKWRFCNVKQDVQRKGRVFFYWGYNRSTYSKSDFHISGEGYDLTYRDIKAKDKPTPFSTTDYVQPSNISKPQYNYRIGYYINDRWSISFGMDHMKYFMIEDQHLKVEGHVSPEASSTYAGTYDHETEVNWRMLWVHHSDGLNYTSVEAEYNLPLWIASSKKFYLDVMGNIGAGIVVPKTYVMTLNKEEDNKFHIAGGGPSAKLGARFTFWRNFYFEAAAKAGYVWMPNILVNSEGTAEANQHFGWIQGYGALGISIPLIK